ncbi:translation initiation factor eIF 4e-like domain-containing protein [Dichotomocladium elegans]|nr:translation initiation factor eIF 4e-like domain-containing protein [Dichotomocladium elegans]
MADVDTRPTPADIDEKKQTAVEDTPTAAETSTDAANNDQVTTVFHDRINYNVKHPLQNAWTMWFDNPGKKASVQSWSQNLKEIVTIDTVEDFWGVYNNVAKVNHLESNSNYHFFKKGVRPEWEDPANANGGKFSIQFPRNRTGEAINDYWMYLLLAMIGEQFTYENEVCGAVISVRKVFFRLALWVRSSERNNVTETMGRQIKEFLAVPPNLTLEFTPHTDSAAKSQKFSI